MKQQILAEVKDADVASIAQEYGASEGFVREWMSLFDLDLSGYDYTAMSPEETISFFLLDIKTSLREFLGGADQLGRQGGL